MLKGGLASRKSQCRSLCLSSRKVSPTGCRHQCPGSPGSSGRASRWCSSIPARRWKYRLWLYRRCRYRRRSPGRTFWLTRTCRRCRSRGHIPGRRRVPASPPAGAPCTAGCGTRRRPCLPRWRICLGNTHRP